jgi:hypothetical protein
MSRIFQRIPRDRAAGFMILELFIAFAIIACLLSTSFPLFRTMAKLEKNLNLEEIRNRKVIHARETIKRGNAAALSLRDFCGAFAHGSNTNLDVPLPRKLRTLRPQFRPKSGSAILTFVSPRMQVFTAISARSTGYGREEIAGCLFPPELSGLTHTLVATVDGSWLANISGRRSGRLTECGPLRTIMADVRATSTGLSLLEPKRGVPLGISLGGFAVEDVFSIFVDRRGTLRRLSLIKQENQPLSENWQSLKLERPRESGAELLAKIELRSDKFHSADELVIPWCKGVDDSLFVNFL